MSINLYSDGGCSGNPGPGAWAFVAVGPGLHAADSGTAEQTTNNRMELTAVIEALRFLGSSYPESAAVVITDSQYVKQGITDWIRRWEKNGWRTTGRKPVKNRDLWQALSALDRSVRPQWRWVRGHAGERYNEECDRLVRDRLREMAGGRRTGLQAPGSAGR